MKLGRAPATNNNLIAGFSNCFTFSFYLFPFRFQLPALSFSLCLLPYALCAKRSAPCDTPQSSALLSYPSLPRRSGRSYWGYISLLSIFVSPAAPLLIIPKFLNPPIPKFPNLSIPELLFLFQIIHIPASKIPLRRQFHFFVSRDV